MKLFRAVLVLCSVFAVTAAERTFDFSELKTGSLPPGWKGFVAGMPGKPGDWQIIQDEAPTAFTPLIPGAVKTSRRAVLAQLSREEVDERFPVLAFEGERYGDFTARLRIKLVDGKLEQMAGLAFRISDPGNFYVVRASGLGRNLRFYKFVNGQRSAPIGPELPLEGNHWYELGVKVDANRIQVSLDGKNVMPELTDNSHLSGQIGFFTKSDSVSYFGDLSLTYKPLETLASSLVRETLEKQPRLLDVQVLGKTTERNELHVMGAKDPKVLGRAATESELKTFAESRPYCSRGIGTNVVTQPLFDRNGDTIGVARFSMKPFPGQLEDALVTKTIPWVQAMNKRIAASKDLTE